MRKKKRMPAALLAAAVLIGGLFGCAANGEDALSGSGLPPEELFEPLESGTPIEQSGTVAENGRFVLCWDEEKKAVSLTDKQTGRMWGTMPEDLLRQEDDVRGHALVQAALTVSYAEPTALGTTEITSTAGAVRRGRVLAFAEAGGLRVWYHFDELSISVPLVYRLLEDGLQVACDPREIREGDIRVCAVAIAPMLCSVKNDTAESYLFVPSGSGALIGTETVPDEKTYREEVFGTDPAHNTLITRTNTESVRLPVFGVKRGTDAMLGVISAGAATAAVRAQAGNERVGYSSVYAEFAIRGAETVEDAKVGTHRYIQIFSDEKNAEERLAVDYYPLAGEDAGYVGMAARYRRYLTDGGLQAQETTEQPLFLTVLGGVQLKASFLGIPYRTTKALTTTDEVRSIIDDVSARTGVHPAVLLSGFGSGGAQPDKPAGGLTVGSVMGGERGLQALAADCAGRGIPLFMDFDLANFSRAGSGISTLSGAAKAPNRQTVKRFPVHLTMRTPDESVPAAYLLSHAKLPGLAQKAVDKAKDWGLAGISFSSLDRAAYSDYGSADGAVKSGSEARLTAVYDKAAQAGLMRAADAANVYAVRGAACLFSVPLGNSGFDAFSQSVPFYAMVFKGLLPMGSEAADLSFDPEETLLRAAEAGCGIGYTVTGSFDRALLDAKIPRLGSTVYADRAQQIAEAVQKILPLLHAVEGAQIVSHRIDGDVRTVGYDNGATVIVNFGEAAAETAHGSVAARSFSVVAKEEKR